MINKTTQDKICTVVNNYITHKLSCTFLRVDSAEADYCSCNIGKRRVAMVKELIDVFNARE